VNEDVIEMQSEFVYFEMNVVNERDFRVYLVMFLIQLMIEGDLVNQVKHDFVEDEEQLVVKLDFSKI
jgi:hypothetical protein